MIRVQAPSRLHFGLLSLPAAGEKDMRRFGGVGLMVQSPGISLSVEPAAEWSAHGPLVERVLAFAQRFAATFAPEQARPHRITVEACAPEHAGLGTGTQLGLAVGRALAAAFGFPEMDALELARRVGRGERSALGIHGFAHGGFVVDGGKGPSTTVAPLLVRMDFPEAWRIVLMLPAWAQGLHGPAEREAFRRLQQQGFPAATTDALCRLTLLGMLPALVERDLSAFGEALHEFNARVGDAFAPAQGGTYAHPRLAEVVEFIRQQGVAGTGQSSWGPTVFAVAGDEAQAANLARRLRQQFALADGEVLVTAANCAGALLHAA
jgi:beta-RFAP synthase